MGLRPRISLENGGKVTHNGRLLIKWAVAEASAIFWRSRDLLEVLKIWKFLDKRKENYKEREQNHGEKSMSNRSKAAPKNEAEMQIEHGESVSASTTRRRLREAGPNGRKPGYYLHYKWAVLFDRQCIYISMDSTHSRMPCASSGTGMLLTKSYLGYLGPYWSKTTWSRPFFPLYGSLRRCLHHLNTEASKWFKTGKRNGSLGACGWFHFWRPS